MTCTLTCFVLKTGICFCCFLGSAVCSCCHACAKCMDLKTLSIGCFYTHWTSLNPTCICFSFICINLESDNVARNCFWITWGLFFFPLLNVLPKAAYNHLKLKSIFYGLLNRVFLYNSWWLFAILVLWNEVICYHLIYTISRIGHAVDTQGHGFHIIVKFWTWYNTDMLAIYWSCDHRVECT